MLAANDRGLSSIAAVSAPVSIYIKVGYLDLQYSSSLVFIMALPTPALIVLALVTYYAGLFFFSNKAPKGLRLPPGPTGFPLIGNVFQYPRLHPWRVFAEWSKIYGMLFLLDKSQLLHDTFVQARYSTSPS